MKTVRLMRDHIEHRDGKVIRHRAGAEIEVSDADAQYIAQATIEHRKALREHAATVYGTPESQQP